MREWAIAYLMTCAVEVPLVIALVRSLGWRARRAPGALTMAWALQFTHPVLWLIRPDGVLPLVVAEAAIVVVEGCALWWWAVTRADEPRTRATLERALLVALIANAASFLLGLAVSAGLAILA
ncbi:MAG TPA: hypothetical protein PKA93_07950 [Arachnia sp.]|nr:hypothetical protein [Arachnia sp.]